MEFENIVNSSKVIKTVDELNNIKGLNNKFIYNYNEKDNWFNIIHSIEKLIQESDIIAKQISGILISNLVNENILNFSIYEDKETIEENTKTIQNYATHCITR